MYTMKLESGQQVGGPLGTREGAVKMALHIANKRSEQIDVICPNGEVLTIHPASES